MTFRELHVKSGKFGGLTNDALTKILKQRLEGCSDANFEMLNKVIMHMPRFKEQFSVEKPSEATTNFSNSHLETIYNLQMWALPASAFQDDVLIDILEGNPDLKDHLKHYTHIFSGSRNILKIVQGDNVLLELGKAAVWCSEMLKYLAKYVPCIPIFVLPLLLRSYPFSEVLERCAPGIFIFDMIHLYRDLFPFCDKHRDKCASFCLSYRGTSDEVKVSKRGAYKFVGCLLAFGALTSIDLSIVHEFLLQLYPASVKAAFNKFIKDGAFLFEAEPLKKKGLYCLNRTVEDRLGVIAEPAEPAKSVSAKQEPKTNLEEEVKPKSFAQAIAAGPKSTPTPKAKPTPQVTPQLAAKPTVQSAANPTPQPAPRSTPQPAPRTNPGDTLRSAEEMIVHLAVLACGGKGPSIKPRIVLDEVINREYQKICGEGLATFDIQHALTESGRFLYMNDGQNVLLM